MKIKALAAIFKRGKFLRIWENPSGEQWITNGVAVYSMAGMPELTPDTLLKIFDVPDDKKSEWNIESEPMPADICEICADYRTEKIPLEPMETQIRYKGVTNLFLRSESGSEIIAIDEKFIKPLSDDMEYLRYFKCKLKSGFAVILYDALNVQAVILPRRIGDAVKELLEIGRYFRDGQSVKDCFPPVGNAESEEEIPDEDRQIRMEGEENG